MKKNVKLRSRIGQERIRDPEGRLTDWITGARFVWIETPETPLPRRMDIGPFHASLYHREMKEVCRRCLKKGHQARDCNNEEVCLTCHLPGHTKRQCRAGMTYALQARHHYDYDGDYSDDDIEENTVRNESTTQENYEDDNNISIWDIERNEQNTNVGQTREGNFSEDDYPSLSGVPQGDTDEVSEEEEGGDKTISKETNENNDEDMINADVDTVAGQSAKEEGKTMNEERKQDKIERYQGCREKKIESENGKVTEDRTDEQTTSRGRKKSTEKMTKTTHKKNDAKITKFLHRSRSESVKRRQPESPTKNLLPVNKKGNNAK